MGSPRGKLTFWLNCRFLHVRVPSILFHPEFLSLEWGNFDPLYFSSQMWNHFCTNSTDYPASSGSMEKFCHSFFSSATGSPHFAATKVFCFYCIFYWSIFWFLSVAFCLSIDSVDSNGATYILYRLLFSMSRGPSHFRFLSSGNAAAKAFFWIIFTCPLHCTPYYYLSYLCIVCISILCISIFKISKRLHRSTYPNSVSLPLPNY